jgi:hypothetical protein
MRHYLGARHAGFWHDERVVRHSGTILAQEATRTTAKAHVKDEYAVLQTGRGDMVSIFGA